MAIDATERVFEVLRNYIAQHGYAPSYRELLRLADLHSTSHVKYCLNRLAQQGRVVCGPKGYARAVRVCEKATRDGA